MNNDPDIDLDDDLQGVDFDQNGNGSSTYSADPSSTGGSSAANNPRTYASRQDVEALTLMDAPVWIFDIVRRSIWFANPAAVDLWSADSQEALLSRNFKDDMSDATQNRLDGYLDVFVKNERVNEQWTFYPHSAKESVVVDCTCQGICIEEGRVAMLVQGTIQFKAGDDTKTKVMTLKEQEALRATEMLRHLPVAVCMTDLDGNVLEQNPEALAVFGNVPPPPAATATDAATDATDEIKDEAKKEEDGDEQVVPTTTPVKPKQSSKAQPVSTFIKRFVDRELGRRVLEQARTNKDVSLEALQITVHGDQCWTSIKVRQTKDPVTSKPILLYSSRDITAVVDAQRQATQAELAKLDLLADMAHAVRTPLQHVVGVVELLTKQREFKALQDGNSDARHFSTLLQSSAQLLMTVIHDLMDTVGNVSPTNRNVDDHHNSGMHKSKMVGMESDNNHPLKHIGGDMNNNNANNKTPAKGKDHHRRILLEHGPLDVREVLKNAVATIKPQAHAKDLTVRVTIHSRSLNNGTAVLMGDTHRLGQVLFEILHNAVKHTSQGGITIGVRRLSLKSSRRVRLRFDIKDSGVGMNLEQQRQCLTPIKERSVTGNTTTATGGGVGLLRCKSLIDAMGGTMGVHSKPGQGATFWVEVPLLRTASRPPSMPKFSNAARGRNSNSNLSSSQRRKQQISSLDPVQDEGGMHILIIDKDHAGRSVMVALLEESGHVVSTAEDGDAMVALVNQETFDVVLLDTQLPCVATGDGTSRLGALEATKALRCTGFSPETLPILALTAAVPRADFPELGLNDWLTKPLLVKDIQKAITNAICNMGARSVSSGSISSKGSTHPSSHGELHADDFRDSSFHESSGRLTGATHTTHSTTDSRPVMPRRGSFSSLYSALSENVQAAMDPVQKAPKQ